MSKRVAPGPVKAKLVKRGRRIQCPLGSGAEVVTAVVVMANGKVAVCARTSEAECQVPCDVNCEIGPVHCLYGHVVRWKRPDGHDLAACDEQAVWHVHYLRPAQEVRLA